MTVKSLLMLLLFPVFAALPARAQSRPADQLYLPIVTHVGSYSADLAVTNLTADKVSINLLFLPLNGPINPNGWRLNVLTIDPGHSETHEIGEFGIAGQGQLIIDACKVGAFCSPSADPASDPMAPRYRENTGAMRAVSASVRIYSQVTPSGLTGVFGGLGTRGDSIVATPWYMLPGADLAPIGMDHVQIVGIRSDARYSTQIGLVNGSQFSTTFLTAILFDGTGVERGRWTERLGPLESVKRGAEQMFPALASNRLNRQPSITGAWIRVQQGDVQPTEQARSMAGCEDGCPRFDVYASVTDSASGDFSIRVAEFETVNQSSEVAAAWKDTPERPLEIPAIKRGPQGSAPSRSVKVESVLQARPVTSEVLPPCRIVGTANDFRWEEVTGDQVRVVMHLSTADLQRLPPELCGATRIESK